MTAATPAPATQPTASDPPPQPLPTDPEQLVLLLDREPADHKERTRVANALLAYTEQKPEDHKTRNALNSWARAHGRLGRVPAHGDLITSWRVLMALKVISIGMSTADLVALLGPPTGQTGLVATWYANSGAAANPAFDAALENGVVVRIAIASR